MEKFTQEQNRLVVENMGIVYFCMKKLHVRSEDWSEIEAEGLFGLIQAARYFDSSKKYHFVTYAHKVIIQKITSYYRNKAEYWQYNDSDPVVLETILDTEDFVQQYLDREAICETLSIVLNRLNTKCKVFMLLSMGGMYYKDIAVTCKIPQSTVTYYIRTGRIKLKTDMKNKIKYTKKYQVYFQEDSICITFLLEDNLNSSANCNLFYLENKIVVLYCNVFCYLQDNKITLKFPIDATYFIFLAEVIGYLENVNPNFNNDD